MAMATGKATKRTTKKTRKRTNDRFIEQPGLMSNVRRAPGLKSVKRGK